MSSESPPFGSADPFTKFWTEFWGKLSECGSAPASPSADVMNQMRRVFFDAMARQADEFMRSEAFLAAMKQAMDSSLAWQQSLNQFLSKGLQTAQMPSRVDADHMAVLVRGMEERVLARLEELSQRVGRLERAETGGASSAGKSAGAGKKSTERRKARSRQG